MGFYGIDVSTYQRTLDMAAVKAAGNQFVGVKAVASYKPELTEADHYRENVDRIMAAGLPKYPYAVPNSQNSPEATAQFQMDIAYRVSDTDRWMLDNEPLDGYRVFWLDDDVARYWAEMAKLGVPPSKGIQYCPAHLTRQFQWPKLRALREQGLVIQWVSYGDKDPYYEDGEEPFTGTTGLDNPEMHQFTSSYTIPGYDGLIDRVYSRLDSAAQLFGGEGTPMPRTFDGMVAWAKNEAANGNILDNWGGWCEKFINNSAAFNQAFGYAVVAGRNSGPLRTDYQNAGRGAIIYWAGVWIGGRENGHDAWVYEPGPDPLLLMASNAAKFPAWGHGIGLIRLSEYQRLFGHPLMGWTYRHGTETLNLSGTAGGGTTPIDNTTPTKQGRLIMPVYHWGPDSTESGDVRARGGVLLHEFLGPLYPSSAEEAQLWKQEYVPVGGFGHTNASDQPLKTDLDGRPYDVLVQSARDRKAQYEAQLARISGGDPVATAQKVVELLGPQFVTQIVNGTRQAVEEALEGLDVPIDVNYDLIEERAKRAIRDVLGGLDA